MSLERAPSNTGTLASVVSNTTTVAPGPSTKPPGFFKRKLNNKLGIPLQTDVDTLVAEGFGEDAVRNALKYSHGDVDYSHRLLVHERDHTTTPDQGCFICRVGGVKNLRKANQKGTTTMSLTGMAYG
ncbi:uncharacterized protein LOC62_07G009182 [Vanrija pseudolonga]|uniref:UBA domain-containing protein n=1 Tax=Vanrija pseudolonga TaxID=143232 RepID=A0AAF0YJA4_9TREE|nr:hypothetical protein LOC62_07G009182 [Vanrija pseudolonga]